MIGRRRRRATLGAMLAAVMTGQPLPISPWALVAAVLFRKLGWRGNGTVIALLLAAALWLDGPWGPAQALAVAAGWGYMLWRWRPSVVHARREARQDARAARPARQVEKLTARAAAITRPPRARPQDPTASVKLLPGGAVMVAGWPDATDDTPGSEVWPKLVEAVSAVMGARYRVAKAEPTRNRARFEPVPPLPAVVSYSYVDLGPRRFALGMGEDGPVVWEVSVHSHLLVGGATNKGKTVFLRARIADALAKGWQNIAIDGKLSGAFAYLEGRPGVLMVEDESPSACARGVTTARAEMERRYAAARERRRGIPSPTPPPLLVVVDEFTSIGVALGKRRAEEYYRDLLLLLQQGREAGVHLILAGQRPDVSLMGDAGGAAREQLELRVGVGPLSGVLRKMLFEEHAPEAAGSEDAPGRALVAARGAVPERFQAWWLADPSDAATSPADRRAAEAALPAKAAA